MIDLSGVNLRSRDPAHLADGANIEADYSTDARDLTQTIDSPALGKVSDQHGSNTLIHLNSHK
ncbi:MAG: hypothetical protein CM1200mP41_18980 [Gammaproteobacteria bacterium]|nr:MAG: hypothetical protein CM1200mP41_18980 [Gammaproteobacteria bacterium]